MWEFKDITSDLSVLTVRNFLHANSSYYVQHGLYVVRVIEHEEKVSNKQHVGHQKIWSASERAFHPVYHAVNAVRVDDEQQRR